MLQESLVNYWVGTLDDSEHLLSEHGRALACVEAEK